MHFSVLLALVFIALQNPVPTPSKFSEPQQNQPTARQQPGDTDQRGTEQSPLVVQTLEPPKSQAEIKQEREDREQKTTNDGRIVILTGVLAVVAIGQLGVYLYQAIKLRETVKAAVEQSAAMNRHIGGAARSATAMENVAATMQANAAKQLRAYLTVIIGTAIYQDKENEKIFEGKPLRVNNGFTPARNIRHWTKAAILPFPMPDDFVLPAVKEVFVGQGIIGAHQNASMSIMLDEQVPDVEVANIKCGKGKALYVWGVVQYEDIFGEITHTTRFAKSSLG